MNRFKRFALVAAALAATVTAIAQNNGKIGVVAHRGYWKSAEAKGAENSIAALKAAQDYGFVGSEFDVHMTSDNVLVVNHDNSIGGVDIQTNPYSALKDIKLSNGETVPTLEEYLLAGAKVPATLLVFELKPQANEERDILLADKGIETLKKLGLYDPSKVAFISFSYAACKRIAMIAPQFTNQYLNGDKSPEELEKEGINGLDYHYSVLRKHPEWVAAAHRRGMSVNAWTVNKPEDIQEMIDLGVDFITTNEPVLVRHMLGFREMYTICDYE